MWPSQGYEAPREGCSSDVVFVSTQSLFSCQTRNWDLSTWGKTEESSDRVNDLPPPSLSRTSAPPPIPLTPPSSPLPPRPGFPCTSSHTNPGQVAEDPGLRFGILSVRLQKESNWKIKTGKAEQRTPLSGATRWWSGVEAGPLSRFSPLAGLWPRALDLPTQTRSFVGHYVLLARA